MKRILVSGVAATFLLVSILASSASAHNFVANTSLTIHKSPTGDTHPGHDVVIFGKLRSGHHSCEVHKVVRLMKKRPGPDKLLGRDRTDTEGDYSFLRNPTRDHDRLHADSRVRSTPRTGTLTSVWPADPRTCSSTSVRTEIRD